MKHSPHIKLCVLLVVTTYVLVAARADAAALVAALACAVMMGAMLWTNARPGSHGRH
jgi:hypothetical protein